MKILKILIFCSFSFYGYGMDEKEKCDVQLISQKEEFMLYFIGLAQKLFSQPIHFHDKHSARYLEVKSNIDAMILAELIQYSIVLLR